MVDSPVSSAAGRGEPPSSPRSTRRPTIWSRLSKFIHANPEIAMEEVKASAACADFLAERGFAVERGVASVADGVRRGRRRPAGRASPSWPSTTRCPGSGHGCGHNLIAIAGIGAGVGLAAALPHLADGGSVTVFGTPAEEAVGGKILMAEAGRLRRHRRGDGGAPGDDRGGLPDRRGERSGAGLPGDPDRLPRQDGPRRGRPLQRDQRPQRPDRDLQRDQRPAPARQERRPHPRHHQPRRQRAERRPGLRRRRLPGPGADPRLPGRVGRAGARTSPRGRR